MLAASTHLDYHWRMKLTREVRLWSNTEDWRAHGTRDRTKRVRADSGDVVCTPQNTWAGDGGDEASGAFWILRATVDGDVDPTTGYVCDIRVIDEWLRGSLANAIRSRITGSDDVRCPAAACLRGAVRNAPPSIPPSITGGVIEWEVSPFTRYAVAIKKSETVSLARSYEFSASHRLAAPSYSDEENRRVFGKCSNPHGHGHNYVVEVTVLGTPDATTGQMIPVVELDRIVNERVIEPFDHKNLNVECAEFADLNPSVENIARVVFKRLEGRFGSARLSGNSPRSSDST